MLSDEALLRLIDDVYAAALVPSRYANFVRSLREHLKARYSGFATRLSIASPTMTDGAEQAWLDAYRSHYSQMDPYCERISLRLHVGQACAAGEIVAPEELRKTEFYNDFLVKVDFSEGLVGLVARDAGASSILTVLFDSSRVDQRAGLDFLSQLMPHIQRSIAMCHHLSEARTERQLSEQLLDRISCAAFVTTPGSRLLRTNAAADRLLALRDGVHSSQDGLRASHAEDNRLLRRDIAHALPAVRGARWQRMTRLRRPSGKQPLLAIVGPIVARMAEPLGLASEQVLLLVRDPETRPSILPHTLCRALGLTLAESRMLSLLVQGLSLAEAAEKLGISQHTARNQLKAVFSKTDTHRQSDLVRRVLVALPG